MCFLDILSVLLCNEAWSKVPDLTGTFLICGQTKSLSWATWPSLAFHMRRRSKFSPKRADLTGITNIAFMMMDASYFGRLQILHMVGSV